MSSAAKNGMVVPSSSSWRAGDTDSSCICAPPLPGARRDRSPETTHHHSTALNQLEGPQKPMSSPSFPHLNEKVYRDKNCFFFFAYRKIRDFNSHGNSLRKVRCRMEFNTELCTMQYSETEFKCKCCKD